MFSTPYLILDPALHNIADIAMQELMLRYNLKKLPLIEQSIDSKFYWRPTFYWKRETEYLVVEVAERPLPNTLKSEFMDITSSGLPLRIITVYPENNKLSTADYHKEVAKIKQAGIGYISVDESLGRATLHYKGLSSLLAIPSINFLRLKPSLRPKVQDAYDIYMNGNPKHGVQELGQLMEKYMKDLAEQAISKKTLIKSGYKPNGPFYNLTKLIDELTEEKVLDLGILGNCRSFVYPRNDTSHHPRTIAGIKRVENKLRENFEKGVSILEELPRRFSEKNYKFRV